MTLIECFTQSHVDNIMACLCLRPEQLVMIGNAPEMREPIKRYQKLLKQRSVATTITTCDVQGMGLDDIFAAVKKVVLNAEECFVDLAGGDERVIMAIGAVLAELPVEARKRIRVGKFDHETGVIRDCGSDSPKNRTKAKHLTVKELIELHGGVLHPETYQPPKDSSVRDLAGLWDVVCEDPKAWNQGHTLLGQFEGWSDSKTQVFLPLAHMRSGIRDFETKEKTVRDLLRKLHQHGVIADQSSRNNLEYTYASPLLRYCTKKAGNVLEVKTLLEGRSVLENGAPYFGDCQMSVSIDWDGVVHSTAEGVSDTRNEIDVVLMRGTTPLFVSCKNGSIGEEELYKLHTVAQRFGGPYAKKMLIATDLEQKSPAAIRAFIQRAWDMDIFLVTDAAELSKEEWREIFQKAMQ